MEEKKGHLLLDYVIHKDRTYREKPACLIVFSPLQAQFEDDKLAWVLDSRSTEGYLGPCIRNKDTNGSR
jgi:hypothetical protein